MATLAKNHGRGGRRLAREPALLPHLSPAPRSHFCIPNSIVIDSKRAILAYRACSCRRKTRLAVTRRLFCMCTTSEEST